MDSIVLDASVITDIMLEDRPRNKEGKLLFRFISQNNIKVRVPFIAVFEQMAAIVNLKMEAIKRGAELHGNSEVSMQNTLNLDPIPMDIAFLSKYHSEEIPYMKAEDYLYVVVAKVDKLPLITEDEKQYQKAKEAGVETYKIGEFIEKYQLDDALKIRS